MNGWISLLLHSLFCLNIAESSLHLPKPSLKIVGGVVANITEAPYQASIRAENGQHFCGGTILTNRTILTAAHCVIGTSRRLYVVVGVNEVNVGDLNPVTLAVVHKNYNNETMENDLAILRVQKDLNLDNVNRRALPLAIEVPPDGTMCQISGWGSTHYNPGIAPASVKLRKTHVPIYNADECRALLEIVEGQICAGFIGGGHDTCQGDSGGPLQCNGEITGIVSWGVGCAWPYNPGVYTSVPFFKEWIQLHINFSVPQIKTDWVTILLLISSFTCSIYNTSGMFF